jgi:hypothetical protein
MWDISQIRETAPSEYESALCKALMEILSAGQHDLAEIVQALNDGDIEPEAGGTWTGESFTAEMARLGGGPEHDPVQKIRR